MSAAGVVTARPVAAADSAQTIYTSALAREETVRAALIADDARADLLTDVRAVVRAYQSIVRLYPASGYCDNALWQAGRLSLDAYRRFGEPQDQATGVRLLRLLETEYPISTLARQVTAELLRTRAPASPRSGAAALAPDPATPPRLATITAIRRMVLADAVRIVIEIDAEVSFHEERLDSPPRVFLDLPSTRAAPALLDKTLRFDGDADVIRQVRIGRHPNHTTRVVLEAAGVSSYNVYPMYGPYRLVIDCVRANGATAAPAPAGDAHAAVAPLPAGPPVTAAVTPLPGLTVPQAPESARSDGAIAPSATIPPTPNVGFSIARQLGLGVSRIVIDPGHGGHDPGAKGKGVTEAELVLDVALRVEKLLKNVQGVEVILTRRTDEFVPLQERTAIANREGADVFLSIHANASEKASARGIETYFLNFADNLSAAAVAARENAASGQAMGALPDLVKAIALNNKLDESHDFAVHVQRAMLERLRGANRTVRDLGVKQAPFVVLIGAAMPSVLAEVSFVTNPQEAKLLRGAAYRQRIAQALFNAIRKYQTSLKRSSTIAHQ